MDSRVPSAVSAPPAIPRAVWIYFAAVACIGTAFIAAFTVGTVAVFVITDTRALSGLPATIGTLGTAIGAAALSRIMASRGRRIGLLSGVVVATAGSGAALLALTLASAPILAVVLLLASFVGFGFGNASAQLARYAAADLVPAADRGRAVGLVVWAGTIGAVVGPNLPNLVAPSGARPEMGDLLAGFGVVAVFVLAAFLILALLVRREPVRPETAEPIPAPGGAAGAAPPSQPQPTLAGVYRLPQARIGLVALVAGGFVMVAIMTMTPVHLIEAGHGLGMVGLVISAHTFGMFAFSPISGRLADRAGPTPTIAGGFAALATAGVLAAAAPVEGGIFLTLALFLLGLGWNLTFVAGSSLLTRGVPEAIRIRLQGVTDAFVWTSAAASSVLAGLVLELTDYGLLALVAAGLALISVALILFERRALVPAEG